MPVTKISVTAEVKSKFLLEFSSQDKSRKDFAALVVKKGLDKLIKTDNPPGNPPRTIPSADGGNKSVEFDSIRNKELIAELENFKKKYSYISQPVANRACLYAGLNISLPWR